MAVTEDGDIQSSVQELLDIAEYDERGSQNISIPITGADIRHIQAQEAVCQRIVQQLESRLRRLSIETNRRLEGGAHANGARRNDDAQEIVADDLSPTVRAVFGNAAVSRLVPILSNLMGDRIDRDALLPKTQDKEANDEVMNEDVAAAQSLTRPAWRAAALYAHLLHLPGALGCGLVELEALAALAALMRRWAQECRGREANLVEEGAGSRDSLVSYRRRSNKTLSPPKKRIRRHAPPRRGSNTSNLTDDESDNDLVVSRKQENVLLHGFQVSKTLSRIPRQKEFFSWSSEAREAIFDALLAGFSTSAALGADIEHIIATLRTCINKETPKVSRHPTSVILLRGMLSFLTLKEVVPNGERGKMAVHTAAVNVVEGLIESASAAVRPNSLLNPVSPRRSRRSSFSRTTISPANSTLTKARRESLLVSTPALKSRYSSQHGLTPINYHHYKPRPVLSTFLGLMQKIVTAAGLESNNFRKPTVTCLQRCLPKLPHEERCHFLRFLILLSQSKISVHRLIGCETIESVLSQEWLVRDHAQDPAGRVDANDDEDEDTEENGMKLPDALMWALQGRLMDRITAVRTRAAASIEKALSHNEQIISMPLLEVLRRRVSNDESASVRKAAASAMTILLSLKTNWISNDDINVLCEMTCDSSTNARQTAAEGLTILLEGLRDKNTDDRDDGVENEDCPLDVVAHAWTRSVLPLVLDEETKCAGKGSSLVDRVIIAPILASDGHQALLAWKILATIGGLSGQQGVSRSEMHSLQIALKQLAVDDWARIYTQLLNRVCRVAHATMPDATGDASNVNSADDGIRRVGVWCLFEAMVCYQPKDQEAIIDNLRESIEGTDFILMAWQAMSLLLSKESDLKTASASLQVTKGTVRSCLSVMTNIAPGIDALDAQDSVKHLSKTIQQIALPTDLIGSAISAYIAVNTSDEVSMHFLESVEHCSGWIRETYSLCEQVITSIFQNFSDSTQTELSADDNQRLVRALFTVGELSMIGFRQDEDEKDKTSHRPSIAPRSSTASNFRPSIASNHRSSVASSQRWSVASNQQHSVATATVGPAPPKCERPSQILEELIISMLAHTVPGRRDVLTPVIVRAHACAVLGKLCLRDERLAKQSLNLLARELHPNMKNTTPSVQSNALIVLGDLCVRYTNMADRYLPVMASCLQSGCSNPETNYLMPTNPESAVVRKHAVLLLSSLLLQDYIKWRGLLFHRFLVASADEDVDVAKLADSVLCGPLKVRFPKLFHNHFVESLFVLNRCTAHPMYIAAANTGDGGSGIAVGFDGINLQGVVGEAKRRLIYQLMLSKLTDEEKIGITARLAKEVLGEALSSTGDLGRVCAQPITANDMQNPRIESARSVLSDTFFVLTSKLMRVGKGSSGTSGGVDEEDMVDDPNVTATNPARQINIAKNRLFAKISRKHLIEIVLPILCNLKAVLQASRSPMLKDLMKYLLDIYKTYKPEVKEFLANDPALLQEIEYDARQKQPQQQAQGGKSPGPNRG